jgi:ribosomal protein L7/L12
MTVLELADLDKVKEEKYGVSASSPSCSSSSNSKAAPEK